MSGGNCNISATPRHDNSHKSPEDLITGIYHHDHACIVNWRELMNSALAKRIVVLTSEQGMTIWNNNNTTNESKNNIWVNRIYQHFRIHNVNKYNYELWIFERKYSTLNSNIFSGLSGAGWSSLKPLWIIPLLLLLLLLHSWCCWSDLVGSGLVRVSLCYDLNTRHRLLNILWAHILSCFCYNNEREFEK